MMMIVQAALVSAVDGHIENLGTMEISNDATGSMSNANYTVKLFARTKGKGAGKLIRTAHIRGWKRNSKTAWALVTAAVEAVKPEKKRTGDIAPKKG